MAVALADLQIVYFDPKQHDVSEFDCDDADLNDFLKNDAWRYQTHNLSHTRVAFLHGKLVGYITLLADCVILRTGEKKKVLDEDKDLHRTLYTFPAVKIGRLGVQKELQHTGVGTQLLKYTIGTVVRLNAELNVGCRLITLDAYPRSVDWYEAKGFQFNKHYDKHPKKLTLIGGYIRRAFGKTPKPVHPSMRYDILKSPPIK